MWYTGYFFLFLLVATASCFTFLTVRTRHFDRDSFITICNLGIMGLAGWLPVLWHDPVAMGLFHASLVAAMFLTYDDKEGMPAFYGVSAMLLCDVSYIFLPSIPFPANSWGFPSNLFYWQSILNIILLTLYVVTLKKCYTNSRQYRYGRPFDHVKNRTLFESWESGEQRASH